MSFLRAIFSGVFPLFAQQFFIKLGSNSALVILAGVATLYCGVAVLFGLYGRQIRERSPIAKKTWAASLSNESLEAADSPITVPEAVYSMEA